MKYLYLFAFFLSASLSSFAQSNYKPGYVVNLKNDTLKGFIDYKEWEINPKTFSFKSNLNQSQHQSFSVEDANGFGITGAEHFQKFIFTKTIASNNINKISTHLDTSRIRDTSFMKILVKGKNVSLYEFTDQTKTRFYIQSGQKYQPEELEFYIYYTNEDQITYQRLYPFRSQLQDLADTYNVKDPKLLTKIKYANYNDDDIQNIIELINGGKSSQNLRSNKVSGFMLFAGGAARFNKLELGGGETFFPDGTKTNVTSPVISAGVDFFVNKYTQRLVFRVEAEVSNAHYTIPETETNGNNTKASIDFKQTNISLVPQIKYNVYSKDKLKIFISGGLGLNFSSYNQYYYLLNFNNVSTIKRYNYPDFLHYYNEARAKAGLVIGNKVEIYAVGGFSSSLTNTESAPAGVSYYQAGINYFF
ncbi:MAG: hypothetical protein JST50_14410 [Bacteroidetes bacterium]|jgi:hypothetical protein|nr:hypothetical protein [Bacteroidota bacterium]